MPPVVIAGALGAVGAIGGALVSSNAASNATSEAANAAAQNNALQSQIYNSNKALIQPYVNAGNTAETTLQGFLGLGGNADASKAALGDFLNSTGYQFNFNQGQDAITGNKAASGLLDSGSTLKSLDSFGTGLADQYGQQYEQNLQDQVNTGVSGVNALTGAGTNYANSVSSNNNSAASVSATAGLASASQINGLIGNAFKAYGSLSGGQTFGGSSFGGGGGQAAVNAFSPQLAGAW